MHLLISASSEGMDELALVRRHCELGKLLQHYGKNLQTVVGSYNGVRELTWHLEEVSTSNAALRTLAKHFNQKSFMLYWPKAMIAEIYHLGESPLYDSQETIQIVEVTRISGRQLPENYTMFKDHRYLMRLEDYVPST
jgi:hypothetical protein